MGSFSDQVEGIHTLVDGQGETAARLSDAVEQIGDSSGMTRESLDTIHTIVNELVGHADGLREEMGELWGMGAAVEEPEDDAQPG